MTAKTSAQKLARVKSPSAKRNANRIEFELAHGGLVSRTHMDDSPDEYRSPKMTIHPTVDHAKAHLAKMLGHAFPKD